MSWEIFEGKNLHVKEPFIRVRPNGMASLNVAIRRYLGPTIQILIDSSGRKLAFRSCEAVDKSAYRLGAATTYIDLAKVFKKLEFKVSASHRIYGKQTVDSSENRIVEFSLK